MEDFLCFHEMVLLSFFTQQHPFSDLIVPLSQSVKEEQVTLGIVKHLL